MLAEYALDDTMTNLIDFLADARHWCDGNGHSFAELDRQAYHHYLQEIESECGDPS